MGGNDLDGWLGALMHLHCAAEDGAAEARRANAKNESTVLALEIEKRLDVTLRHICHVEQM